MAREALRLKIDGEKALDEINDVAGALRGAGKDDVPALKARADIQFGLLRKILPDVRSIELTGEDGKPLDFKPFQHIDSSASG